MRRIGRPARDEAAPGGQVAQDEGRPHAVGDGVVQVDLERVDGQRRVGRGLEHEAQRVAARLLGLEAGLAAEQHVELRLAIQRIVGHRAAHRVAQAGRREGLGGV